jgi:AcrR family transcriptional regulator
MRDQIKQLALDLLIQHGVRGVSFGDLAKTLRTTRANIHYHFGSKQKLVEEVLEDYVDATLSGMESILIRDDLTLVEKIEETLAISRRRHAKYNGNGKTGRPWSLIARVRQDSEALTPKGRAALKRFAAGLDAGITSAVCRAKERGEFDPSMPTEDVALQWISIANSAGPITQDAGNFERLEQLYLAFSRIIQHAYGLKPAHGAASAGRGKRLAKRRERAGA